MDAHSFEAQYSDGKTKISLNVGVYIFQEDNVYISYCPALDLSGYGETENAAKTSFGQTLGMYIEYCLHKNTLVKDLQKHGWKIKSMKQKRIKAPERRISDDTRLIDLTVGELKELFGSLIPKNEIVAPAKTGQNLVYGIRGIMDLFHCSETTAYRLKSGVIKKAVRQVGRMIVVDADLALSLFTEKRR